MPAIKDRTNNPTQDRILEAAVQLFSRQGYSGSSTSEIARLAGVSEVTVFRHFPRKRELFWAAAESRLRRIRIRRRKSADRTPGNHRIACRNCLSASGNRAPALSQPV
jgi:AcrR family transcriptional regulator